MQMWVYVVRRLLLIVPVVIGVMTITFVLVNALPVTERLIIAIGPSKTGYAPTCLNGTQACVCPHPFGNPPSCTNLVYQRGIALLGLDKPVFVQWGIYMVNSLTFNWGNTDKNSYASGQAGLSGASVHVTDVLSWYLPYTLQLAALSLFLILILAIPVGNYAAVHRNRPFDQGARIMSFSGLAFPTFLLGLLLLYSAVDLAGGLSKVCNNLSFPYRYFFGSWPDPNCAPGQMLPAWTGYATHFQTSPTGFPTVDSIIHGDWWLAWQTFYRMLLPAFVIAFGSIAGILRFVRNSMLEVMNLDFIRTARAKGVPERQVVRRHAGRNSLNVTVTVLGLTFAGFVGGFPVVETVFDLKGVGRLLVNSVNPAGFDFGLVFGSTLLFTFIVVIANIIVDVLYAFLDPRVRLG